MNFDYATHYIFYIHNLRKISNLVFMATFLIFLLFSSMTMSAVLAQQRHSIIGRGSTLTPTSNSSWLSPSGLYAFGFFPHNNAYAVGIFLAGISAKTVVWTANVDNPTVGEDTILQLTDGGRLILQQSGRDNKGITDPLAAIAWASMLDNGNFVLYGDNSTVIWQSFNHPTNSLLAGQRLPPPQELVSSASDTDYTRGFFRVKMQKDGNLVQYPVNTEDSAPHAYYASDTPGSGNNVSLNLDGNGYLYLLNGTSVLKNITDPVYSLQRSIYLLRLDVDGILRLYSHPLTWDGNWNAIWESTKNKCLPKGICGLNSFCILMDEVASCKCLPGFGDVQSGNGTAGCTRVSAVGICDNSNSSASYEIRTEENTVWEMNSYAELVTSTVDECKGVCLGDCNCEAASFQDGICRKQSLPLRYGRRTQRDSYTVLVKVSSAKPRTDPGGVSGNSGKVTESRLPSNIMSISISLVAVSVLLMAASIIYVYRKQRAYMKIIIQNGEASLSSDAPLRAFNYAYLAKATDDFKEELGKGASSTVFKGFLQCIQRVVAVKRLEKECMREREFQTEMNTIGKTYHRNLVRLLGYSLDGPNRLLVFEYMCNGSLADILFKTDKLPGWEDRIKIARDIARGILYLHEECETQIIHCDIKPQNILMDEHGRAKISDFGIAKLLKQDQSNTDTGIRGTRGYVAPEWHRNQPITVKVDVYSFGIVLLEIICCRRSIKLNLPEDEAVLEEWVYSCYEAGELGKLVGDNIVDERNLERIVKIGLWCIQYDPSLRPTMKKVLLMLEGSVDIPVPPNQTSFLSYIEYTTLSFQETT